VGTGGTVRTVGSAGSEPGRGFRVLLRRIALAELSGAALC
jgi:hypothetical protein